MGTQVLAACGLIIGLSTSASAAEPPEAPPPQAAVAAPEDEGEEPAETDFAENPGRPILDNWTQYDLKILTFRWGIYTLEDWGTSYQTPASEAQVDVVRAFKVRDFRVSMSGKLATRRSITYTSGIMYDLTENAWFLRETGVQVAIPELWGNVFVGRQKEGISLSKITNGYAGWAMERAAITDIIPILADGIKWLGGLPNHHANWNFAAYYNDLTAGPSKDWYDYNFVGRVAVLPIRNDTTGALLHLGVAYHWGKFSHGETDIKSKPESGTAPFFLDTGTFAADHDNLVGLEAYFRDGSWFGGAEYFFDNVSAPDVGDPFFHGGNVFVTWLMTGEQRPYIDVGGKVGFIKPKRSAFSGGPGAWEAVLQFSYADYDSGPIEGGRFWRATPQINWYIDDMASLRFNYGLGSLDRFGTQELTQFFQARLEIKIN